MPSATPPSAEPRLALSRRKNWMRLAQRAFSGWVQRARHTDMVFLLFVAALTGLLAGASTLVFGAAIHAVQRFLWGVVEPNLGLLREMPWWKLLLWPAVGGAAVGLVTTFFVSAFLSMTRCVELQIGCVLRQCLVRRRPDR